MAARRKILRVSGGLRLEGEVADRFLEIKRILGLTNDTEVFRVMINHYFMDRVLVTADFIEWFCARNHKPVMKISEVIEEYELYQKQKASG